MWEDFKVGHNHRDPGKVSKVMVEYSPLTNQVQTKSHPIFHSPIIQKANSFLKKSIPFQCFREKPKKLASFEITGQFPFLNPQELTFSARIAPKNKKKCTQKKKALIHPKKTPIFKHGTIDTKMLSILNRHSHPRQRVQGQKVHLGQTSHLKTQCEFGGAF